MSQIRSIIKDIEAIGFKYSFTYNGILHFNPSKTPLVMVEFIANEIVRVQYRTAYCKHIKTMLVMRVVDWLKSKPEEPFVNAIKNEGYELLDLLDWHVANIEDEYEVRRNDSLHKFDSFENVVKFIVGSAKPTMKLPAVVRFIDSLYGYSRKGDWFVFDADPRFRLNLREVPTPRYNSITLTVDLAGTTISSTFERGQISEINDCHIMRTLRIITVGIKSSAEKDKWISKRINETANYANVKQALAEIGYEYCDSGHVGEEYFVSNLTKHAGSIHITIEDKYHILVCSGDDYEENSFALGTDPAEIVAWILKQQPMYVDLVVAHAKNNAICTELEATKNNLAQIREAVQ